jgi:hypothetical protein
MGGMRRIDASDPNKTCTQCGTVYPRTSEFFHLHKPSKDGLKPRCKTCQVRSQKQFFANNPEYRKRCNDSARRWSVENPERRQAVSYASFVRHREAIKARKRASYHASPELKAKIRRDLNAWRKNNPEKAKAASRRRAARRATVPWYRLSSNISRRIRRGLSNPELKGRRPWEMLVGFTLADLRRRLETLFQPGMSWENYGTDWHLDHIRPVSSFNCTSVDQPEFHECWGLSNLQPLWADENMRKGARLDWRPEGERWAS